ncbi:MAG: hypothetical protein ACE5IR_07405 [bacterium]
MTDSILTQQAAKWKNQESKRKMENDKLRFKRESKKFPALSKSSFSQSMQRIDMVQRIFDFSFVFLLFNFCSLIFLQKSAKDEKLYYKREFLLCQGR